MPKGTIRTIRDSDRDWVRKFVNDRWGSETVVTRGVSHAPLELPGFVALDGRERVGLITFRVEGAGAEIVTLDSTRPCVGIGTALLRKAMDAVRETGVERLWLVTSNDNARALRFYQKRGFNLVAVHRNALAASRKLKPEIPLLGRDGIPLRDEIELERLL